MLNAKCYMSQVLESISGHPNKEMVIVQEIKHVSSATELGETPERQQLQKQPRKDWDAIAAIDAAIATNGDQCEQLLQHRILECKCRMLK